MKKAKSMAEEDFPAEECPICMGALVDPCRTRCGHIFCSECLKQSFPAETATSAGRCPLCRGAISLFSTVSIATESALRPPAVSTIFGTTFLQGGRPGVASYHFEVPPVRRCREPPGTQRLFPNLLSRPFQDACEATL